MLREKCTGNIRILWPAEKVVLLSYVHIGDGLNKRQFIKTILVWKNKPIFVIIENKIISSYPVFTII